MSNRIHFGEPIELEISQEELPPASLLTSGAGHLRQALFQVYIVQDIHSQMWRHVNQTPNVECGGVLVGHPFRTPDNQITFVVIVAAIPQHSDNRSIGHFTVGPSEIAAARSEIERYYPGLVSVGWYHSHPGHGVFLSGQDMTIVQSIYDSPWHIAMVLDSQQDREGIFVGPQGYQLGQLGNRRQAASWIGLRREPDSIKAIALYNRAREAQGEGKVQDAAVALDQLQELVLHSADLRHWHNGYRDSAGLKTQLSCQPSQPHNIPAIQTTSPAPVSPQLNGPMPRQTGWDWLLPFALVTTTAFAVFVILVASLWPERAGQMIMLGWGIFLSLLAVASSMSIIVSENALRSASLGRQSPGQRSHTPAERIAAMVLTGLVLLVWSGYALLQTPPVGTVRRNMETPNTRSGVTGIEPSATHETTAPSLPTEVARPTSTIAVQPRTSPVIESTVTAPGMNIPQHRSPFDNPNLSTPMFQLPELFHR